MIALLKRLLFFWYPQPHSTLSAKLHVRVTEDERVIIQAWCKRTGYNVETWLRQTALTHIPPEFKQQFLPNHTERKALEALDDEVPSEMLQLTLEDPVAEADEYREIIKDSPLRYDHPCTHLRALYTRFKRTECEGTCTAPTLVGRPCMWPAATARDCHRYEPNGLARRINQR